jgi:glutathione S-transferase
LYYDQQRAAARRRTREFLAHRLPKFIGYFERVAQRNPGGGPGLVGSHITYADLSVAQVVAGLRFAFPAAAGTALADCPRLCALHDEVFARPRIASYLASGRRIPFNRDGIFRDYPELDAGAPAARP